MNKDNNILFRVKCVNKHPFLTLGKTYNVVWEDETHYGLEDDLGYYKEHFNLIKEESTMTKKDLKAGMMVEIARGDRALIVPNTKGLQLVSLDINMSMGYNWIASIEDYNAYFEHEENGLTIEKIYGLSICGRFWEYDRRDLLWQREDYKRLQKENKELQKKFDLQVEANKALIEKLDYYKEKASFQNPDDFFIDFKKFNKEEIEEMVKIAKKAFIRLDKIFAKADLNGYKVEGIFQLDSEGKGKGDKENYNGKPFSWVILLDDHSERAENRKEAGEKALNNIFKVAKEYGYEETGVPEVYERHGYYHIFCMLSGKFELGGISNGMV